MRFDMSYLKRIWNTLWKYKYALLVVAVGVVLMLWPSGNKSAEPEDEDSQTSATQSADDLEKRLEEVLSKVYGVGRVDVVLTVETDAEYVYAQETSQSSDEDDASVSTDSQSGVVTVRDSDGGEEPVLVKSLGPKYRGAVVVCDGADSAGVRLKVISAVSALTGLASDEISVVKMA